MKLAKYLVIKKQKLVKYLTFNMTLRLMISRTPIQSPDLPTNMQHKIIAATRSYG